MKKLISVLLVVCLALSLAAFTACENDEKTIVVGASVTPHAVILNNCVKAVLAESGWKLKVVEYNDYVLPNKATQSGDLDANYFQHKPYLDDFNLKNSTSLVSVAKIHYEPFGVYGGKTTSIASLKDGASIGIPNDGSNEARALKLLESLGLITLKSSADWTATKLDIATNPHNFNVVELEAAQLTQQLATLDVAVINGNYALSGGLNVANALALEDANGSAAQTYANVLVVKEGNEQSEKTLALIAAFADARVSKFISETFKNAVVALS